MYESFFLFFYSCACVLSHFSHARLFATLWTVACQASLCMGFSRQEYWNWLPFPSPGDLPNPRIKPTSLMSPALADRFLTTSATWEAYFIRSDFNMFQSIGTFIQFLNFIGVRLLYNIVLVSTVQQNESVRHKPISSPFWAPFPFRAPQCIKQSSLRNTVCSHQLSILYICVNPHLPILFPLPFLPWYPYICSLSVSLFCFANKIIYTIFLDSMYMH